MYLVLDNGWLYTYNQLSASCYLQVEPRQGHLCHLKISEVVFLDMIDLFVGKCDVTLLPFPHFLLFLSEIT